MHFKNVFCFHPQVIEWHTDKLSFVIFILLTVVKIEPGYLSKTTMVAQDRHYVSLGFLSLYSYGLLLKLLENISRNTSIRDELRPS
jgi:hypothetical protein